MANSLSLVTPVMQRYHTCKLLTVGVLPIFMLMYTIPGPKVQLKRLKMELS